MVEELAGSDDVASALSEDAPRSPNMPEDDVLLAAVVSELEPVAAVEAEPSNDVL